MRSSPRALDKGWFESTVTNLGLNFSFSYLRENAAVPYVLRKLRAKEPVIFFRWYPDIAVIKLKDEVNLIQFPQMQFDRNPKNLHEINPDPKVSKIANGYPAIVISKYANFEALRGDKTLETFFESYTMTKDLMDDLVTRAYNDSGRLGAYGGACEWVKDHSGVVARWISNSQASSLTEEVGIAIVAFLLAVALTAIAYAYRVEHSKRKIQTVLTAEVAKNEFLQRRALSANLKESQLQSTVLQLQMQNERIKQHIAVSDMTAIQSRLIKENASHIEQNIRSEFKLDWKVITFKRLLGSGTFGDCYEGEIGAQKVAVSRLLVRKGERGRGEERRGDKNTGHTTCDATKVRK